MQTLTDAQIKHMVNRFLGWRLPETFSPDGGVSFKATFNEGTPYEAKHQPSGTNILNATEAEAMVRYLVEGLSEVPASGDPIITMSTPIREVVRIEHSGRFFVHGEEVHTTDEVRDGFIWFVNYLREEAGLPSISMHGQVTAASSDEPKGDA